MASTLKKYTIDDVVLAYDIARNIEGKILLAGSPAYIFKDKNAWSEELKILNETPDTPSYRVKELTMTSKNVPLIMLDIGDEGETTKCSAIIYVNKNKEHEEGFTPIEDSPRGRASLVNRNVYKVGNPYTIYKLKLNELGSSLEIVLSDEQKPINVTTTELFMYFRFATDNPDVEGDIICAETLIK